MTLKKILFPLAFSINYLIGYTQEIDQEKSDLRIFNDFILENGVEEQQTGNYTLDFIDSISNPLIQTKYLLSVRNASTSIVIYEPGKYNEGLIKSHSALIRDKYILEINNPKITEKDLKEQWVNSRISSFDSIMKSLPEVYKKQKDSEKQKQLLSEPEKKTKNRIFR